MGTILSEIGMFNASVFFAVEYPFQQMWTYQSGLQNIFDATIFLILQVQRILDVIIQTQFRTVFSPLSLYCELRK